MSYLNLIEEFHRWWALSYATKPAPHTEMVCVAFADHIRQQLQESQKVAPP